MRLLTLILVVGLLFPLTTYRADAQTRAEIMEQIEQLQKQLRAVQRRVFDDNSPYFQDGQDGTAGTGASASQGTLQSDRVLLADMSVKLQQLERQLSLLTGKIEEMGFELRTLREENDRFKRDVEFRLNTLEGGEMAGAATANDAMVPEQDQRDLPVSDGQKALPEPASETTTVAASVPALPDGTPTQQYEHAYSLLQRGQYDQAERAFTAFLEQNGSDDLAGNAQYWLGETYYVRKDYARAAQAFFKGYQDYRDSTKGPDSLLKLGLSLASLGEPTEACAALDELEVRFPGASERIKRRAQTEQTRLNCT